MTTGETEETVTCGGQKRTDRRTGGGGEGDMKLSFTTLSTIAIQAGQSQIVVSVLRSGSLIHLQLVQVHPGLCEIGSNQEENHTLIQEQQQLMEKLKKHEKEVLSVVEKSRQAEQRRRRDEGTMKRSKKQEEEEGVYKAMNASLNEGWSLLLRLLERRQEVLTLASDFYRRALEFADSIDKLEDLRIRPDSDRLTEEQLTYDSMRRDLLGKSLQVLTCSSVLLQKLRQLQRTEALQRRGGVLQDEQDEEEESSQCSRGMALKLEELMEALQDRRRRADQAVRLQLQQAENGNMVHKTEEEESRQTGSEDWSLTVDQILDQNLQSGSTSALNTDLMSRTEETRDLKTGSISDVNPESRSEPTRDVAPGSRLEETLNLDPKSKSGSGLKPGHRFEEKRELQPDSRTDLQSGFKSDLQTGSGLDVKPGSKPEQTRDVTRSRSEENTNESGPRLDPKTESRSNVKPRSRLDFKPKSRLDQPTNLQPGFKSNLKPGSRLKETLKLLLGSISNAQPGSGLDVNSESSLEPSRDMTPESRSDETIHLDPKFETGSDLKSGVRFEETSELQSQLQLQSESRSDLQPRSGLDMENETRLEFKPESRSEETINLQSGLKLNFQSGSRSDMQPGSRLDPKSDSRADLNPKSRSEPTRDLAPKSRAEETRNFDPKTETGSDLEPKARLEETSDLQSRLQFQSESRSDLQPGSGLDVKIESRLEFKPESDMQPGSRLDPKSDSRADLNPRSRSEPTRDLAPEPRSEETSNLDPKPKTGSDLEPKTRLEETRDLQSQLQQQSGLRPDLQPGSGLDVKTESRLDEIINLQSRFKLNLQFGSRSDVQPGSRLDTRPESRVDLNPESRSQETTDLQSRPTSEESRSPNSESRSETTELRIESPLDVKSGSGSEETRDLQSGSRSEAEDISLSEPSRKKEETKLHRAAPTNTSSGQVGGLESLLGNKTQSGEDHSRQVLLANQRQQLLSSCEQLVDKIWSWVQQGSSMLSNSSEAGRQLLEAEDTLNTHLQLQTQAETALCYKQTNSLEAEVEMQLKRKAHISGHDAENMKQILDQIRALHPDPTSRTSPLPPSEPSRQLSPLRALTQQLKKGNAGRISPAWLGVPSANLTGSLSPELAGRADLVLKELQSLNGKINSNLQLLQPYVTFLRTAQQVEEEMEELKEIYKRRPEEEEEEKQEEGEAGSSNIRTASSYKSPVKKKDVTACWQAAEQKFLTTQELGNNCVHMAAMVPGAPLNLQSVVSVVQQTLEHLSRIKEDVNELQSQQQLQIQQQQDYCRKHQEKLLKTMQDLNCVSELLDSCTMMDLGSDLQTSKLLERFSQARPHFKQLEAEVEYIKKNWETLRGVQDRLEVMELKERAVKEEDLSELLKLQNRVQNKIHQSESVLDLTSSFHSTSQQLESLLQSDLVSPLTGSTGLCGSNEAELSRVREEQQQKIQNLFDTASTLKTDICNAINRSGWTGFRVEQLEARLLSLDSLCVTWQNEAARREEKLRRELLTCRLNDDINQLRDSFKELKKRFSNLKFNYQKRNDRARNMKAVRNQLQQVELYDEKLQALSKRLQGVTARLGSEIKDGGVAREAEDAINELQRQMGDFDRSVSEHQKTLDMTRRLQQAMEEYQFWCEEASATIARVGKFSSECRSTEAVSVLYRQFEKFVWPTVPQQEERISQIAELAVRLHGVEEGQRYIEKTVSKHSEMVESIRELSDGLMKLEAKLKLENLKKQQKNGEKVMKEDGETERRRESETEEKDEENEKKLKENRKKKKTEQTDNRSTQEATDMYELKETGHTPELTAEHDGKDVPVKRQTAASRKPPLQKSRSLDTDRQTESSHRQHSEKLPSSYCSTHTFSLSSSPVEANRQIHTIHSQLQLVTAEPQATPPPSVTGPLFSDIQREFQRKEMQEMGQPRVSAFSGSSATPLQDASAGGLLEAELQQQEAMTEDSLSNDEYDCVSPDDMSLPPLAETPESNIFQSDIEEGYCFSSHSAHISQYSHHSEHSGTGPGAVRQLRVSSRTESCPTPPTSRHSGTSRFRSDSSSFVQSPLTVPAPSLLTSTLCTILRTGETSTANVPLAADPELSFPSGSNAAQKNSTSKSCSNKDNVSEKRSPSQSESLLKEHNSQYNEAQKISTQVKITQNVASKVDTLPQSFNGPDPDLHKDKITPQDKGFLKCGTTFPKTTTATCLPQSFSGSESGLHRDFNPSRTCTETPTISKPQTNSLTNTSTSKITQKTINSSLSNSHCVLPQASSCLISSQESPSSQSETLPRLNPVPQDRGRTQSPSLTDSILHKNKTQDTGFLKSCATCPQTSTTIPLPQTYLDSSSNLDQDVPSSQTSKVTSSVSVPKSGSLTTATTVTQQTEYCPPAPPNRSPQENSIAQSQTLPQIDPVSQARGFAQRPSLADAVLNKDRTLHTGLLKSYATCPKSSTTIPQDRNLSQSYPDSKSDVDQDVPSSQTSKPTSSVSKPQSSSLKTAITVTQQTVYCQSSPPDYHCNVPQASNNSRSQQGSPFPQGHGGPTEAHVPIPPKPDGFSNISISSSAITSSHQTVYSLNESLSSTCTQQCVHDPGMTPSSPAKPTAPPQPESQTQAFAQQANPHVTPPSSPPHLLTPDQDPNICQPMVVREEIRLTPQIQGPSLPAPPTLPQAKAESLPQGKASKSGPPCFTRPLSRATVMEGSPVTLEVEVTGNPEPMLTWSKDGEVSAAGPGRTLACEASDSDGGLYEVRAVDYHDAQRAAGNSSGDKWLVTEVFDIISVDWQNWFGTLCVLLWLIYLIIL